eukprot:2444272-Amphidinium_carterae.1
MPAEVFFGELVGCALWGWGRRKNGLAKLGLANLVTSLRGLSRDDGSLALRIALLVFLAALQRTHAAHFANDNIARLSNPL